MKVLLSIFPIALLMVGCGNPESKPDLSNTAPEKDPMESAVEWSKLQNRNRDAYIPNTDKPYSGWAKQNYDNEQVKVLAEFTDGSVTHLKQWQKNGIPKWDVSYLKGRVSLSDVPLENLSDSNRSHQHGPWTSWHENGQKRGEGNFKNGKPNGPMNGWHENGQKLIEINWKDDKLDGLATAWFKNGQKSRIANYKDGKQNGPVINWLKNGQKESERNFKDDKLISVEIWKPNGEKCPVTNVKDGNGVLVNYWEDGTERSRTTYKDGEKVKP